jgi:hypothetical protein
MEDFKLDNRVMKTAPRAAAAATLMLFAVGNADAALINGFTDGSFSTSVFVSVVERNATGQVLRNLVIDTGARTLDVFQGAEWSTTVAQESAILGFIGSAAGGSTIRFNVGGGLNDQSFSTDLQGFLTSGVAVGPGEDSFSQLGSAITNIDTFIGDTANGTFSANGILAANAAIDPGWHNSSWGSDVGGALETGNEIIFGQMSSLVGWKTDPNFVIVRSELGILNSNLATGDISYSAIPLPAAAWLLMPMAAALVPRLKRRKAA